MVLLSSHLWINNKLILKTKQKATTNKTNKNLSEILLIKYFRVLYFLKIYFSVFSFPCLFCVQGAEGYAFHKACVKVRGQLVRVGFLSLRFFPKDQTVRSLKQQRNILRFWSTLETKSQTRRQELHFSASGHKPMCTPYRTLWPLIGTKLWGRGPGKETCPLKEIVTPSPSSPCLKVDWLFWEGFLCPGDWQTLLNWLLREQAMLCLYLTTVLQWISKGLFCKCCPSQ